MLVYVADWQLTKFIFTLQNVALLGNYSITSDTTLFKKNYNTYFQARSLIRI